MDWKGIVEKGPEFKFLFGRLEHELWQEYTSFILSLNSSLGDWSYYRPTYSWYPAIGLNSSLGDWSAFIFSISFNTLEFKFLFGRLEQ